VTSEYQFIYFAVLEFLELYGRQLIVTEELGPENDESQTVA